MKWIGSLILFSSITLSAAQCPWPSQFELDARLGSYREGAGALVWAPICQRCDRVTFVQAQAGNYRDLWTGNFGVGHRQLFCPNWAWGVNAFGDISYSSSGHVYGQGSIGGELLGKCWEGRINGYFTGNRRHVIDKVGVFGQGIEINGNNIDADFDAFLKEERTYYGFDAELGRGICFEHGQLWGYAGYYYFRDRGVKDIHGPRLRFEYQLDNPLCWYGTRLTVGGEYDYDPVHKSEGSLLVSFRIPLCGRAYRRSCMPCGRSCLSVCRQMGNRVRREPTVWVERIDRSEFREEELAQIFFVDGTNTLGAGTQVDPTTLQDAVNRAEVGDFIFLLNVMNLPIDGGASILAMQTDQTVIGFGDAASTAIDFGPFGVLTITDLNPSPHRATLIGDAGSTLITLADWATVRGIQLDGMGTADVGIRGTNVDSVLLFDLDSLTSMGITSFDDCGIIINGGASPVLRQISVVDIANNNAIELNNTTQARLETIFVEMVTAGSGVLFNGGSNATIEHLTIADVGAEALSFNGFNSASVTDATIFSIATSWIFMDACTGTFTFEQAVLGPTTPSVAGILIGDNAATTTFTSSSLTQTSGDAVLVTMNSAPIDFTDLAITYDGIPITAAIQILSSSGPVSFDNAVIDVTGGALPAFLLASNTGLVSMDQMAINMTGSSGLAIDSTDASNLWVTTSMITTGAPTPPNVIQNINTDTSGMITFDNLTISSIDVTDEVIDIQAIGNSSVTFTMTDSMLSASMVSSGVRAIKSGAAGGSFMDVTVNNLTSILTTAPDGHLFFVTDPTLSNATYRVVANMNRLTSAAIGINVDLDSSGVAPVTADIQLTNNRVEAFTGTGILVNSRLLSGGTSYIATNNIIPLATGNGFQITGGVMGAAPLNAVLTGNTVTTAGAIGYVGTTVASFSGDLCITFNGNSAIAAVDGIDLTNGGTGIFTVTPTTTGNIVADLLAINPVGSVSLTGIFNSSQVPCLP